MAIILIILGFVLRLFKLGTRAFDGDEGVILFQATPGSFHEMIVRVSNDAHPPLTVFFSWVFNKIVPQSEFYYRLIPAIIGTLALVAIYFLAKEILGKKEAFKNYLLLLLAAISPYLIFYAQEIRMYNFLLLFAALSTLFSYRLTKKADLKTAFFYILTAILMVYTVYIGFIIIFCQFLFMVLSKVGWKKLLIYLGLIVAGFLPVAKMAYWQISNRLSEGSGIFKLDIIGNIKGVVGAFFRFGSGRLMLDLNPGTLKNMLFHEPLTFILFLILLLVPLVLFINGYKNIKDKKLRLLVNIFFIVSILAGLVYSEMGGRAVRYFIYLYPLFLIVICSVKLTTFNKILLILFVVINLVSLGHRYFVEFKAKNIKDIVAVLDQNYQKGDMVFYKGAMANGQTYVFDFYSKGKFDRYDYWGDYKIGNMAELAKRKEPDIVNNLLQNHPTVWFFPVGYELDKPLNFPNVQIFKMGKDIEGVEETLYKVSN